MRTFLSILMTTLLVSMVSVNTLAEEECKAEQEIIQDCSPWVNCNHNPPNFDGTCCRICYFPELGYREWYCAVHTNDIGFNNEERSKLKAQFLYNGVNTDIRELLIMELNSERDN